MLTQIFKRFASTTKTYGNLKDADRIFTNVYKDSDPYIKGALRRVFFPIYAG
jgi:NADH dehydrogenase (ubiquinone) flavoprotein 1